MARNFAGEQTKAHGMGSEQCSAEEEKGQILYALCSKTGVSSAT